MNGRKKESLQWSSLNERLYQKAEREAKENPKKKEKLNLLKCIQAYRCFPELAKLIKNSPSLIDQIEELRSIWSAFSKMSDEQLSEMAIELIQELS